MDEHTLRVLEWSRVLGRLAAHTSNQMGRQAALELTPSPYPEIVARRLQETREARDLLDHDSGIPLGGIRDIRAIVGRAAVDQQLAPLELLDVAQTAAASQRMKLFLGRKADQCPLLAEIAGNLPVMPNIAARIQEAIADNGEIRDSATPELSKVRSERKIAHSRLMDRLNSILGSERFRQYVQEPIITEREGRYCIPVKSEHRTQFGGIVHDASASGATVFIEPAPCVETGNKLKELDVREEQEISRILTKLTGIVGTSAGDLRTTVTLLANLDLANAKARFADEIAAEEPRINREGRMRLRNARHPLLSGEVVPVDLEVGGRFTTLLLTGPNTGGKTVALKTAGLLAMMAQSGMQVPAAADSDVAIFDQVFADIGDEQDIQQSLSTFSAHLRNIVAIAGSVGPGSLVLLDEIGAGTDPAEGAALAKAVLNALQDRGARVIATTHYGELKEYAYAREGVENAAVEFNKDTLRPTYRVLLGVPGSSHAFYIAGRLGLSESIIEDARGFLSKRDQTTGEVMQQIEESRRKAMDLELEAARQQRDAEAAKKDYEQRVRQVSDLQRTARREAQDEAQAVLRRISDKAENILDELKRANKGKRKGATARLQLSALRSEALEELAPAEPETPEPMPDGGYAPHKGDHVKVVSLNAAGVVLDEPHDGYVTVQIGAMRTTLPIDVLRPQAEKPTPARARSGSDIAMRKAIAISPEIMIRAMRVEEAAPLLEKYIDDAYASGIHQVRVIHGKGTGVMRKFVADFLRAHPVVASFRLADAPDGGDGATMVTFKE